MHTDLILQPFLHFFISQFTPQPPSNAPPSTSPYHSTQTQNSTTSPQRSYDTSTLPQSHPLSYSCCLHAASHWASGPIASAPRDSHPRIPPPTHRQTHPYLGFSLRPAGRGSMETRPAAKKRRMHDGMHARQMMMIVVVVVLLRRRRGVLLSEG